MFGAIREFEEARAQAIAQHRENTRCVAATHLVAPALLCMACGVAIVLVAGCLLARVVVVAVLCGPVIVFASIVTLFVRCATGLARWSLLRNGVLQFLLSIHCLLFSICAMAVVYTTVWVVYRERGDWNHPDALLTPAGVWTAALTSYVTTLYVGLLLLQTMASFESPHRVTPPIETRHRLVPASPTPTTSFWDKGFSLIRKTNLLNWFS